MACVQGRECTRVALKYFEASITIAVGGVDIDIRLLVNMKWFIEEHCIAVKRGGALTHKHFQMVLEGYFTYSHVMNKKIKVVVCYRGGAFWQVNGFDVGL